MKKLFTLICLLFTVLAFGQQYNNEWIDFSKVYYKFKVGTTGLYRIPQSTLSAAGLGATAAEQFKLIRNGQEVPIYTTAPTGPLASDGYIEFWGEANDGKPDLPLYRNPAFQHSDVVSIQSDTAMYFLTVNAGTNLRLVDQTNDVASAITPPEDFFMYTTGNHFRTKINTGYAKNAGEYVLSSSYDKGEFFSSRDIAPSTPLTDALTNMFVYTAGPNASIKFGAFGNAVNNRTVNLKINGTLILDTIMSLFEEVQVPNISIPVSIINTSAANVLFTNTSAVTTDRMVISYYDLTYPRKFNFGASKNFPFTLPAKSDSYNLAITNFNSGTALPVLYDITYGQRYTAVKGGNDTLKFLIPAGMQEHKLVLVNEESANVNNVVSLSSKTFTNFSNSSNQGDYLIISNSILYSDANNVNPIAQYRDYRKSIPGGSYNAIVVDIDELVDQFAFGIKKHPLSIKNFISFARANFAVAPKFVFLIGRGVDYINYRNNQSNALADRINLVPSFGHPASDNMLSSISSSSGVPVTPIGRLSAINAQEVEDYLQKMIEYEQAQQTNPNTIGARLWMKNVLHVTGASQSDLGITLCNYMQGYKDIMDDTLTGTNVHMFCKASANPIEQLSGQGVADLFNEGLSMVTYFGHSSSSTLEFNIDNPENYSNQGKYPVFSVNGCNAGNFFTFRTQRLEVPETLSEKFVLAKERGGIAFLASTHFGIVNYLNIYINGLYKSITNSLYGSSLGSITKNALNQLVTSSANDDFFARIHSEQMTLHGDPALKMNFEEKPDYVLEDPQIKITPSFISIAKNKFNLDIRMYNLGKAINDSLTLEVKRQYPNGSVEVIYREKIKGILYSDSLSLEVPVIGTRDKGLNKLIITIDADNVVTEMDEQNNTITKDFYVYEDEALPAYPYNYSIVNNASQKLFASTADPTSPVKEYVMEIDTTELFNSSLKKSKQITSSGGTMEFDPGITLLDSTVYYWRVSIVPASGGEYHWNTSSFIYINNSTPGFNQSHIYQHLKSDVDNISLDSSSRIWKFGQSTHSIQIRGGVFPTAANQAADISVAIDGNNDSLQSVCGISNIIFTVIDQYTLKPMLNAFPGTGLYGSDDVCGINRIHNFQYNILNRSKRLAAMQFLDMLPKGCYVAVRNTSGTDPLTNTYASDWLADTAYFGSGNSLYNRLLSEGLTDIDSFNRPRAFVFLYKKGEADKFNPSFVFSAGINDKIVMNSNVIVPDTLGTILSPSFGPAKRWESVHWRGFSEEANSSDQIEVDVIGIDLSGTPTTLYTLDKTNMDFDVSAVDPAQYPFMQLKMHNMDATDRTPFQLTYWRMNYEPVPEGALSPNLYFTTKDTLDVGEPLNFGIAFKNISPTAFDSLSVKLTVIDKNNNAHILPLPPKMKPLITGDTIKLNYQIDTRTFSGNNILSVDFNPDNDQPEQYHNNNFLFRNFYVRPDNINPLMDVTFDGIHILNNDIVSSKPHIQIKVKDEAKYMLLSDTSVISELKVRYSDAAGTVRTYKFDNDTLRFTPAQSGANNTATIDFSPYFPTILDDNGQPLNPDGDTYTLTLKSKDESGNSSGSQQYSVSFKVIGKPMISNLLNYPNPFTTSTAFVFTLTGSDVPQNMKIQILTVTGKVVREITKEELGPIHIGRNITEYKWNGTDQYGQRLGNGVYLYRVVTTLNGKRMDKYTADGDDTDKYFNHGYGKMYLMR